MHGLSRQNTPALRRGGRGFARGTGRPAFVAVLALVRMIVSRKTWRSRHSMPFSSPDLTIVVPTFNERENIRPLVDLLSRALDGQAWEVVFVDDDSPDGTAAEVEALGRENGRVRLLHRLGRRGLAGATIEGMLSSVAPFVAVMDADLQHDETKLADMLALLQGDAALDVVIGSRFVDGGNSSAGFSALRKWGSDTATTLARKALRITASDPMSGFFMMRRSSFHTVVTQLHTEGFKILADMLAASRGRWKQAEVGYEFRPRHAGESKMDSAIVLEFLSLVLARLSGGLISIRFVLFAMVGLSGVIVQLAAMRLFLMGLGDMFLVAQSLAVVVAMTTNFLFNNMITYKDRALRGWALLRGLVSFYVVCSVGAVANVGVAGVLYQSFGSPELASLAGAVVGALWNFVASAIFTWRVR